MSPGPRPFVSGSPRVDPNEDHCGPACSRKKLICKLGVYLVTYTFPSCLGNDQIQPETGKSGGEGPMKGGIVRKVANS